MTCAGLKKRRGGDRGEKRRNSDVGAKRNKAILCSTSVLALILGGALAQPASADSVFWNGTASGNWFNDANWVWDGHTPTASDNAYINSNGPLLTSGTHGYASSLFIGTNMTGSLGVDGQLTATTATLGNSAGASGSVSVSGIWSLGGALYIGNEGDGAVTVSNGFVSAGTTYLGAGLGGSGTLTVENNGSFDTGSLFIGYAGTGGTPGAVGGDGTLTVTSGAVSNSGAVIADGIGSTGTATISGSSSTLSNGGAFVVGSGGVGSLTVENGATVDSSVSTTIGNLASSAGSSIVVRGAGSALVDTGTIIVGNNGDATLTIDSQATATSNGSIIGRHSTSSATVTGAGSQWSTGDLRIGGDSNDAGGALGQGTLNVTAGGTVTSTSARLGDVAGMDGTAIVDGASSRWEVTSGSLEIGRSGSGSVTIRNGATLETVHALLGSNAGADGTAIINGSGSSWAASGNIYVGNGGNGDLSVLNGATVTSAAGYIGTIAGSDSSVTVDGAGSQWSMTEPFIAGYMGDATVTLSAGGRISALQGTLGDLAGSSGTMTVTGTGSNWNAFVDNSIAYSGYMNVGRLGDGDLTVSSGGSVTGYRLYIGNETGSSGTVLLTGADSKIEMASRLYIGALGDGTLTLQDGALLTASDIRIAYGAGVTGLLNIGAASGQAAAVAGTINASGIAFGAGDGKLVLNHTGTAYALSADISGNGQVHVENGTTTLSGTNTYTGGTTISGGTLIGSSGSSFGAGAIVNNASLVVNGSGMLTNGISGSGSFEKAGSGTLTLSGANTYTGGTTISGGTLIGSSVSSFGTGAIVNNAALVVNGGGTFTNEISGSGSFEKAGSGTLTLSGANTYTGGTTISGGTLVATTASLAGDVANYGTLVFDQNTDGTFAGDISGTGNLVKDGTGIVTLTGTLTYRGTTTVRAGKLIGNTSTLGGSVINEDQLEFDQAINGTYSSVISGAGSVLKTGSGVLTMSGANSYTGGTTVSAGTLVGNADSFGTGAIANNGSLVINGAGIFANAVSGTGSLEKADTGKLIVTGNSTYTGSTQVSGGTLSVNGSLASIVTVGNGAFLGGNGSIGGLSLLSGGTLAPGNSIGTLTVTGNANLATGSTYAVEVDGSGNADRLAATGTVTIGNNVNLLVTPENGTDTGATYALNTQYTIVTAAGGVTGTFDTITENFAYLTAAVQKSDDQKSVFLTLNRTTADPGGFAAAVSTQNAKSAANAVEALGSGNTLYDKVLYLKTDETQTAFGQLSGELHASVGAALTERSRFGRDAILHRLQDAFAPEAPAGSHDAGVPVNLSPFNGVTFWSSGFGSWSDYGSDGNGAAVDVNGGGVVIGADALVGDSWRFGLAGGYGQDRVSENALNASADVDSYYIAAYGGTTVGPASLRFGAVHALHNVESQRSISFSGFSDSLKGDYDASTSQIFAESSWRFDFDRTHVEPYANLAYVNTHTDGFAETGGAAALSSSSQHYEQVYSTVGLRVGHDFALEDMAGKVTAGVGWRHAFGDMTPETDLSFTSGGVFTVASTGAARDALLLDLSVGFNLTEKASLSFGYNAVLGERIADQAATARLGIKF